MLKLEERARLRELLNKGEFVGPGYVLFLEPTELEEFKGLVKKALAGPEDELPVKPGPLVRKNWKGDESHGKAKRPV